MIMGKINQLIRWIAIAPAALIGFVIPYLAVCVLFVISQNMFLHEHNEKWVSLICPVFACFAGSYFFVYCGWIVSPKFKNYIAVFLMGVLFAIIIGWVVITLMFGGPFKEYVTESIGLSIGLGTVTFRLIKLKSLSVLE
jgi:hypothetical protein